MKRFYFVFFILFFIQFISIAQDFLGYSASEYAGVTAIDIQPANLADNRFRFDMTLGAVSIKAYNNYLGINRFGLKNTNTSLKNYNPLMGSSDYDEDQIKANFIETDDGPRNKSVYFSNRIVLPSFLLEINHKNSIAMTWDVRTFVNADNITPQLAKLIYSDFSEAGLIGKSLSVQNLSFQYMSWAEYGLTYARVLKEDNEHAFKVAGRAKIMQGLASAYVFAKNFQYNYPSDTTMNILNTEVEYGHSSNLYGNNELKYKWVSNPGFGMDLGFVYEWRPEYQKYKYDLDGEKNLWRRDKSKYKFKAGVSLLDVGWIKFTKGQYSHNFKADISMMAFRDKFNLNDPGLIVNGDTSTFNFTSFDDSLISMGSITPGSRTYRMNLPTAFSVQADYRIWKDFDVNFVGYFAFQFKKDPHKVHDFTSFSITPCWDHKWFGLFVPLQYHMLYGWAYGTCVRLGPIIVGTDNMGAFLGNKSFRGADIYFMLKVPVPFAAPKDRDKDGVSDKKDKCKTVPGVWEFMGCPDKDGDRIQDKDDKCPDVAGLAELQGCPDKDGDKITDAEDQCPEVAGLKEFGGCPDTDGDKIIDQKDSCPDIAGLKEFEGCPDKDADGIPDKSDLCPETFGPKELKGCPDMDKDGVLDKDDGCVDVPGPIENKGCPWSDRDKDSIADRDDDCPDAAGPRKYKGCPDTDGDGVLDKDDACVTVKGPTDNKGCPWSDLDNDKIPDREDDCPNAAGPIENKGCPDTDKDGVLDKNDPCIDVPGPVENKGCPWPDSDLDGLKDKDDACPDIFGPVENNGCPPIKEDEKKIIEEAFSHLEFATGKDIIKSTSFTYLNDLAKILKLHTKDWKLKLVGHTDNQGTPDSNLKLSEKRAKAVMKYLVSKGIAADKIIVEWYGHTKPIADNSTEEGRQKNRRVNMSIVTLGDK
ncbi:MAG: DUF5723 family protein [Bacteroidota bacterium]